MRNLQELNTLFLIDNACFAVNSFNILFLPLAISSLIMMDVGMSLFLQVYPFRGSTQFLETVGFFLPKWDTFSYYFLKYIFPTLPSFSPLSDKLVTWKLDSLLLSYIFSVLFLSDIKIGYILLVCFQIHWLFPLSFPNCHSTHPLNCVALLLFLHFSYCEFSSFKISTWFFGISSIPSLRLCISLCFRVFVIAYYSICATGLKNLSDNSSICIILIISSPVSYLLSPRWVEIFPNWNMLSYLELYAINFE